MARDEASALPGVRSLPSRYLRTGRIRAGRLFYALIHQRHAPWLASVKSYFERRPFYPETYESMGALVVAAGFEPTAYRERTPELQRAIPDDQWAIRHMLYLCFLEWFMSPVRLDLQSVARIADTRCWNPIAIARLMSGLVNSHLAARPETAHDPRFWQMIVPALRRIGRPYLLIGDSHSFVCRAVGSRLHDPIIPIHVLCSAGSALGLDNPHSRSGYHAHLARIAVALAEAGLVSQVPILFQFGQVDVEFVSTYRRIRQGEQRFDRAGFEAFCDSVAAGYRNFLGEHFGRPFETSILSIFPPALSDESWAEGYANAHVVSLEGDRSNEAMIEAVKGIEIPPLQERTALHGSFNRRLARICEDEGYGFVDLFTPCLGPDGTLGHRFTVQARGRDHHLDLEPVRSVARPILEQRLRR